MHGVTLVNAILRSGVWGGGGLVLFVGKITVNKVLLYYIPGSWINSYCAGSALPIIV